MQRCITDSDWPLNPQSAIRNPQWMNWCLRVLLILFTVAVLPSVVAAQEVQWRYDYKKAREEAGQKGLPLVIDFGSENCFWCKQLDTRTFRDETVIGLLNERCIPLKIDATKQTSLADALRIQNYPTVVFAGPDGRILGFQEGFVEAPRMKELLTHAIGAVATPEWMNEDYKTAAQSYQNADFTKAIGLLRNILEDGKDRPVQAKARTMLQEIEQQGNAILQRARRDAEHGQKAEAIKAATELAKNFEGTLAGREGSALLATLTARTSQNDSLRATRSRDLLAQAKEDFRMQLYASCLERCDMIVGNFGDLPEATEAGQLLADVKSNPEWMKAACDQAGERLGGLYLGLADSYLKKGQPQQAVYYLERIVQMFPGSKYAETAQAKLAVLQALPARSESKKP
jgi:thioredoxin-like negative regulator of GroEL